MEVYGGIWVYIRVYGGILGADEFLHLTSMDYRQMPYQVPGHVLAVAPPMLSGFTRAVVDSALLSGSSRAKKVGRLKSDDPDILLLAYLQQERGLQRDRVQRQAASLRICRVRRRVRRRTKALQCEEVACNRRSIRSWKHQRQRTVTHLRREHGEVQDHIGMAELVTDIYTDLFTEQTNLPLLAWINKSWSEQAFRALPSLDTRIIRHTLQQFNRGKTCAEDQLVAETLFELDDDVLDLLARSFRQRLMNTSPIAGDDCWDAFFVTLLGKKGYAQRVHDFRPISILPVLYNVCSRVLLLLTEGRMGSLVAPQFAFRTNYQAHEVVFIFMSLIEKSIEWSFPLFVLDGHLLKAYDYTQHKAIITGLRKKRVPPIFIASCESAAR